jgi:hypothetical protein
MATAIDIRKKNVENKKINFFFSQKRSVNSLMSISCSDGYGA